MGYEMFFLNELTKYIARSDPGGLYGFGWTHTQKLKTRVVDYSHDRIEVTAFIEVTGDNVNYSRVSETIQRLINRRIDQFFAKNPDAYDEINPEIDLVIRKK